MEKSIPTGYCYNNLKDVEEKVSHMKFIEKRFEPIDISSELFNLFMIHSTIPGCSEEDFNELLSNCSNDFDCEFFYFTEENSKICKACPHYEVISKEKQHEVKLISYLINYATSKNDISVIKEFLDDGLTLEHFNTVYFNVFGESILKRFYVRELFSAMYYFHEFEIKFSESSLRSFLFSVGLSEFDSVKSFRKFISSDFFAKDVSKVAALNSAKYLVNNAIKSSQNPSEYCVTEEIARRILLKELPQHNADPKTNSRIEKHLKKIKSDFESEKKKTSDEIVSIPIFEDEEMDLIPIEIDLMPTEEVKKNNTLISDEQVKDKVTNKKKEYKNISKADNINGKTKVEEPKEEIKKEESSSNAPSEKTPRKMSFLEMHSEDIPEGTVIEYGLPKNLKFKVDVPSDFSEDPKVIKVHTVPEFEKIDYYLMFLCPVYAEYLNETKELAIYLPPEDLILLLNTKNKGIMRRLSFYFEEERREKVTYDALELHRLLLKNSIVGKNIIGLKQLYEVNNWTSKEFISKKTLFKRASEFDENPFRNLRNYKKANKYLKTLGRRNPVNNRMYKVLEPLHKLFGRSKFVEHHSAIKETYRNYVLSDCTSESISKMVAKSTNLVVYRICLTNVDKIIKTDVYQKNAKELTPFGFEFRLSKKYSVEDLRKDLIKEIYLATLVEITNIKDFFHTSIRVIQIDESGIILCSKIKDHKAAFDIFNQNLAEVSKRLYDGYIPAIKIYKLK